MRIAIEKGNKIKFFRFDGRNIQKFLRLAKEVNGKLDAIWSYSHIEYSEGSNVGLYKNIKRWEDFTGKTAELTAE